MFFEKMLCSPTRCLFSVGYAHWVKAKKRKPPEARDARAWGWLRLAAVAFSIRGVSDRRRLTATARCPSTGERVLNKMNPGAGKKQKFELSKAGCSKRIAYFCTRWLTLRSFVFARRRLGFCYIWLCRFLLSEEERFFTHHQLYRLFEEFVLCHGVLLFASALY